MKKNKIYPWIVVGLLWVVALLNYMDRQMLSTMRDVMSLDIIELESAANFGRLMAAFLWIYGLASPFAGLLADRINRKWLIVSSLLIWSFVTLLMGFTHDFTHLYVLRGIMGISEAIYIPTALALIADYHTDGHRSLAIGLHMTGLYVGQALGGYGAVLAAKYSWQHTFLGFGVVGILYAVVLIFTLYETEEHMLQFSEKDTEYLSFKKQLLKPFRGFKMLLSSLPFWIILLYFATPSLPGWATKNWLPTLFSTNLSINMTAAGPMSTITIAVSSFIGVLIGGVLSDRWVKINIRGRVYMGCIALGLMVPALLLLGFGHTVVTVVGGGLCFGLGIGIFDTSTMPIICQFFSSRYRSTAMGILNMVGVFAGAYITDFLGKSMDDGHLGLDFAKLAGSVIIALFVVFLFLRPKVKDMKEISNK